MRPIVIGAGRGSRLGPETDDIPKALVPVMGRPMLEWILEALGAAGFARKDVIYICGYRAEVVRDVGISVSVANLANVRVETLALSPAPRPGLTSTPTPLADYAGYPLPGRSYYVSLDWSHR